VDEPIEQPAAAPTTAAPTTAAPTTAAPTTRVDGLEPGMTIVRRVRGPRRWPGILSGVLALLMLAATAIGIQLAAHNELALSTYSAYAAIAFSAAALIFGLIAIVKRWGRGAGIVGALVAVLGNPLVLLYGLSALGGS
jgi:hypothetical protein